MVFSAYLLFPYRDVFSSTNHSIGDCLCMIIYNCLNEQNRYLCMPTSIKLFWFSYTVMYFSAYTGQGYLDLLLRITEVFLLFLFVFFSRVQLVRDHCGLKIISHIVHLCAEKTQLEWGWV